MCLDSIIEVAFAFRCNSAGSMKGVGAIKKRLNWVKASIFHYSQVVMKEWGYNC